MNGNSQAVRIPPAFRLATDRVQISRTSQGDPLIHPCPAQRGQALLDTNILIDLIQNRPPQVAERIDQHADDDSLAMSFITWAELLRRTEDNLCREVTRQQLEALNRQVPVPYPDGPALCRQYALQATALRRQATPIGGNDLWSASHALALGATLVSHNLREFTRIEGLAPVDWATAA